MRRVPVAGKPHIYNVRRGGRGHSSSASHHRSAGS